MLPVNDLFGAVSVALGEPLIATGRWHNDHWGLFSAGAVVTGCSLPTELQQGDGPRECRKLSPFGLWVQRALAALSCPAINIAPNPLTAALFVRNEPCRTNVFALSFALSPRHLCAIGDLVRFRWE